MKLMNELERLGAELDAGRVASFGDVAAEARAFAGPGGAALAPLLSSTALRLTGADRLPFLHGQISNDVTGLGVGGANSSLLLNVKGHALAQMRTYRRDEDLVVVVEAGAAETVRAHLQAHIIFDQVEIEVLDDVLVALSLQGPASGAILESVFGEVELRPGSFEEPAFGDDKVLISATRRSSAGGADLLVLGRQFAALVEALVSAGASLVGERALEAARVAAGIAAAAGEGGPGALPQEWGLESLVSYRKGCYLGQEIMARIEARGNLRKRLRGLRLSSRPTDGTVSSGGKPVGKLGSVVEHPELGWLALASIRRELEDGTVLEVGELGAVLSALPFEPSRQKARA